jgi:hypothetical protein
MKPSHERQVEVVIALPASMVLAVIMFKIVTDVLSLSVIASPALLQTVSACHCQQRTTPVAHKAKQKSNEELV